jgi:hypothetical protein
MTAIYLLMVFSPLAPLAMQSKRVAHALTGECSGDCQIDGCSLEHSAAHACCCWQKKLKGTMAHVDEHDMRPVAKTKKVAKSCCSQLPKRDVVQKKFAKTTTIGTAPCGSSKLFALWGTGKMLHLPYLFSGGIPAPLEGTFSPSIPDKLTSHIAEPPHPPPKISFFS